MPNKKRLIDADALDRVLEDFENRHTKSCFVITAKAISKVRQIIYAMKKVDAVEVVRCKDCNHVSICNCVSCLRGVSVYCTKYGKHMMMDDFCSHGERRNDNGKNKAT